MFRRVGIDVRLRGLTAATVVAVIALLSSGYVEITSQLDAQRTVAHLAQLRGAAQEVQYDFADLNGWQTAYAFDVAREGAASAADSAPSRASFLDALTRTRRHLTDLATAAAAGSAQGRQQLDAVVSGLDSFAATDGQIVGLYRKGDRAARDAADALVIGKEITIFNQANTDLDAFVARVTADQTRATAEAEATGVQEQRAGIGIGLAVLALLILVSWVITRSITAPLSSLRDRLEGISHGGGDLTARLDEQGRDELSSIARLFNAFVESIAGVVRELSDEAHSMAAASEKLSAISDRLGSGADEANRQVGTASSSASEVAGSVASMSAATEEMSASIGEIATQASSVSQVARTAVTTVAETSEAMARLNQAGAEIGDIVKVITTIAGQTDLLALNATIEAARAGDAGRGFAVVATEVKDLAHETAKATDDIAGRIGAIQTSTGQAIEAIGRISAVIAQIHERQTTIAAAVEQQTATTQEITRVVSEIAGGADVMADSMGSMSQSVATTTAGVHETRLTAGDLATQAARIENLLSGFTV